MPKITESRKLQHKDKIRNRKLSRWQELLLSDDLMDQNWRINGQYPQQLRDSLKNNCFICGVRKQHNDKSFKKGTKLYDWVSCNFYNRELFEFLESLSYSNNEISPQRDQDVSFSEGDFSGSKNEWRKFFEKLSSMNNTIQHELKICNICKSTFNLHSRYDQRDTLLPPDSIRTRYSKSGLTTREFHEQRKTDSSFQILSNGRHLLDQSENDNQRNDLDGNNDIHDVEGDDVIDNDVKNDDSIGDDVKDDDIIGDDNKGRADVKVGDVINDDVDGDDTNGDNVNVDNGDNVNVDNVEGDDVCSPLLNAESDSLNLLYILPIIDSDQDICCLCLKHTDVHTGFLLNYDLIMKLGKNSIRDRIGDGISISFDTSCGKDFYCQVVCDSCCLFDEDKVQFEPQSVDLRPYVFTHDFFKNRNIEPKPLFDKDLIKTGVVSNLIQEVNEQYMIARQKIDNLTKLALKSQEEIDRLKNQLHQSSLFVYDELTLRKLCGVSIRDVNEIKRYLSHFASTFSIFKGGETVRKLNLDELITAFFFFLRQKIDMFHLCLIINHNKAVTGHRKNAVSRRTLSLYLKKIAFILNGEYQFGNFNHPFYEHFHQNKIFLDNHRQIGKYVDDVLG